MTYTCLLDTRGSLCTVNMKPLYTCHSLTLIGFSLLLIEFSVFGRFTSMLAWDTLVAFFIVFATLQGYGEGDLRQPSKRRRLDVRDEAVKIKNTCTGYKISDNIVHSLVPGTSRVPVSPLHDHLLRREALREIPETG